MFKPTSRKKNEGKGVLVAATNVWTQSNEIKILKKKPPKVQTGGDSRYSCCAVNKPDKIWNIGCQLSSFIMIVLPTFWHLYFFLPCKLFGPSSQSCKVVEVEVRLLLLWAEISLDVPVWVCLWASKASSEEKVAPHWSHTSASAGAADTVEREREREGALWLDGGCACLQESENERTIWTKRLSRTCSGRRDQRTMRLPPKKRGKKAQVKGPKQKRSVRVRQPFLTHSQTHTQQKEAD